MNLLSPQQLGSRTARNRIIFGPHETNLGLARDVSIRHVAYYRRRAIGGAGTIVVEEASVHPSDWPYERCPLAANSGEGWAKIAQALHEEGALAIAALGHAGGQGSSLYTQAPLLAPSPVPEVVSREVPKEMEIDDIAAVTNGYGASARLAIQAGLDGVEVNAGQFSLIRQFLSPVTNQRSDEYGSDRLRFAREVLTEVRGAAGQAIIGLRLSCDELISWGGISPETGIKIALALADLVDYIVAVRGSIYSTWATRQDMHAEPGYNMDLARKFRAALPVRVAIIAQGSIVEVEMAERAIGDGACDAIEMTRAQIADPDLAAKVAQGQAHRIRPCVLCNQACQVRDVRNPIVSCIGEPSSGHESEDPPIEDNGEQPRDVLVVGGGPAGLECARVAALRGHRVRLMERSSELGGSLRIAAGGPGRERLAQLADWLEAECRALGVHIETGREVTADELADTAATVVLCTGSRSGYRDYAIADGAAVVSSREVLEGLALSSSYNSRALTLALSQRERGLSAEEPVCIWDPIGGPIAISVAELLAPKHQVTLITPDLMVGKELSRSGDLTQANIRLHNAGVRMLKSSLLRRVGASEIEVEDRYGGARRTIEAAVLIDAGPSLPDDALWRETGMRLLRAGDAIAPRSVYEAVLEGRRAALQIGYQMGERG